MELTRISDYTIQDVADCLKSLLDTYSTSQVVISQAEQIAAGSQNPAKDIMEWVRKNIQYVPDPENRWLTEIWLMDMENPPAAEDVEFVVSPERILLEWQAGNWVGGDCDDLALLMAALCRSVGIPVRILILDTKNDDFDHAVTEVQIDNGEWIMADPSSHFPFGFSEDYYQRITVW